MTALRIALRIASVLFGLLWIAAAVSKCLAPLEAYEHVARFVPAGVVTTAVLALATAVEAWLGVAMVLGVRRGFILTFLFLLLAMASLLWVVANVSGRVPCGCFSAFSMTTAEDELRFDYFLVALAAVCAVLGFIEDRRARRTAAASGPATPSP